MGMLGLLFKRKYEATCPRCGADLYLISEEVESGRYRCPVCGTESKPPADAVRQHAGWEREQKNKEPEPQRVWVSRESHVYHLPSCRHAARISPKNRVILRSPLEAKAAGYHPCSVCKPPVSNSQPGSSMKAWARARTASRRKGKEATSARKSRAPGIGKISVPVPRNLTSGKAGKLWKLFTYKTRRGKTNILIDLLFHGHGRLGYLLDQVFHTINEGAFKPGKFIRYGNFRRILGLPSFWRLFWKLLKS